MRKAAYLLLGIFILSIGLLFLLFYEPPPPSIWGDKYINMFYEGEASIDHILEKSDYVILVIFTPNNESLEKVGRIARSLASGKDDLLAVNAKAVFIAVKGNYSLYRQFLINDSKMFLAHLWVWSDRQSLFKYISGEENVTVILYSVVAGEAKEFKRLTDPKGQDIFDALQREIVAKA